MQPERRPSFPPTIGRYRIIGRLGKGAMGVVYRAVDDVMGRPVAIKVMMADLEEDPETSARFYREAQVAGQLAHRNVITIFDMGDDGGRPFIVMELIEGYSLADYLKRPETAALEVKVELMRQIGEGLHAAHQRSVYHRDVKPGNLLVRSDGVLKILDFGIARLASSNMTASGLIVGTPDYMSPEQARGQEVDQRSDIFSAGAVCYFILTGRNPFAAPNLPAVLNKVEREDPLPIRETEAPAALSRLVMKALSKAPAARHQTCGELVAELTQFQRTFDLETRQLEEGTRQKLAAMKSLGDERRRLAERIAPDMAANVDAIRSELLQQRPELKDWLAGAQTDEPLRRGALMDLQAEIGRMHRQLAADVANLRTADDAVAAGSRAMEAGDIKTALTSFEKAAEAVPACQRAIVQADACRRHLEELQRKRDETHALIAEAQKSARLGDWSAVVALCDKALTLDRHVTEASGLRSQAVRALEVEATERKRAAETAAQREEAFKYAQAAETALDDREPERAFALAKQALAIDPSLTLARKIHGLASARLTAEAEAKARATAAVERLREARVLVSKGKYKKAREAVAAAAALNPNNAEVAGALAEISALEARADEERERAQLAEERAHTIAPILASARTAEAQRDFVRAAWTAENVLAIDLDCAEARLILKRSREALAAQPALADETVDERSGADPDGTVTLVPITLWSRVVLALRSIGGGRSRRERASAR